MHFDPFCLGGPARPEPIDGPLPPAICLVDDEGPFPVARSFWMRAAAVGMAAALAAGGVGHAFARVRLATAPAVPHAEP